MTARHPRSASQGFWLVWFSFSEAIQHAELKARVTIVTYPQAGVLACMRQAQKQRGSREWWGLGQTGALTLVSGVCRSDLLIPCEEEEPGVTTASEFSRKVYLHSFKLNLLVCKG